MEDALLFQAEADGHAGVGGQGAGVGVCEDCFVVLETGY